MAKLVHEWDRDAQGDGVLVVRKARGKIGVSELEDYLRCNLVGRWQRRYAILLNASEETCGAPGLFESDTAGDCVVLYPVDPDADCPVCGRCGKCRAQEGDV